jgi:hypothetical protein
MKSPGGAKNVAGRELAGTERQGEHFRLGALADSRGAQEHQPSWMFQYPRNRAYPRTKNNTPDTSNPVYHGLHGWHGYRSREYDLSAFICAICGWFELRDFSVYGTKLRLALNPMKLM